MEKKKVFCGSRAKNAASSALLCPAANVSGKWVKDGESVVARRGSDDTSSVGSWLIQRALRNFTSS